MTRLARHLILFVILLTSPAAALELRNVGETLQFVPSADKPAPLAPEDWTRFVARAPADDGTLLMRQDIHLVLADGQTIHNPLAIGVRLYGVYDFYWDGELVGSNRFRGTSASQFSRVIIPIRSLTPGSHRMEMRITALGLKAGEGLNMRIAPAAVEASFFGIHPTVISTFFVATASLLVCGYLLLLWQTGSRRPGLVPAIVLSFSVFALIMLEETKHHFDYPYSWQPLLDALLVPAALLIYGLLAWITATRLGFRRRALWTAPAILLFPLSFIEYLGLDHDVRAFLLLLGYLTALSGYAAVSRVPGARLFLIGFAAAIVALVSGPSGKHLFLMVIALLLAADLGLDIRRRAAEAQRNALLSERLRADLIKRNIQPHFLMNSLTALMEWVETMPEQAVDFIDGLALEFRILSDFAERSTVTLREELELCKVHLNLMAKRLDAELSLETEGLDLDTPIPPAIFHTLFENAFSHNAYAGQTIAFHLTCDRELGLTRFTFRCPLLSSRGTALGTGTGTRYVTARLEECYGNAFRFASKPVGSHWETTIEIG